jgi:citrate lyase subunit beta / citryl-CoA lyase
MEKPTSGGPDTAFRPRRSSLVVPASSARMLEKCRDIAADEVVVDLEDSVVPAEKERARAACVAALRRGGFRAPTVGVRINPLAGPFGYRDVTALLEHPDSALRALLVPKVEDVAALHLLDGLLGCLERETGRARPVELVIQIESAAGVLALGDLLRATPRIAAVAFGPGDYAADLALPQQSIGVSDPAFPGYQWQWPMSQIAHHARAADVLALTGPLADFSDQEAYARDSHVARMLGFHGRHCIHPNQVAWANAAFGPTPREAAQARRLVAAVEEAARAGGGAATLDGAMIDEASRRHALRVLAAARHGG